MQIGPTTPDCVQSPLAPISLKNDYNVDRWMRCPRAGQGYGLTLDVFLVLHGIAASNERFIFLALYDNPAVAVM